MLASKGKCPSLSCSVAKQQAPPSLFTERNHTKMFLLKRLGILFSALDCGQEEVERRKQAALVMQFLIFHAALAKR